MKTNRFATTSEMRQFLIAFFTGTIIITCYHLGLTIMNFLEENTPPYIIVNCNHGGDEDAECEDTEADDTQSQASETLPV